MRRGKAKNEIFCEPAEAYDRIATEYARISEARRAYLDGIERLVISALPRDCRSLLDVGAGDGTRAMRIAEACGIEQLVLLEPSAKMRDLWPAAVSRWEMRAEELHTQTGSFDAITCLWNVLGHIFPQTARLEVLRQCGRLLAPNGLLFVDLSHRYNAVHYGFLATLARIMGDRLSWSERTGDVVAHWEVNGTRYATAGHVFTDAEFRRVLAAAGLKLCKSYAVDYRTGRIRRSKMAGNLLYVLRRG